MTGSPRPDVFDHEHVTVIQPSRGWRMLDLRELWAYRELLWVLTARDIKVRYKQTVLGAAWAIIRPLTMMVIFTVVFGRLAAVPSDGLPYPVFVLAALIPWTFFSTALAAVSQSLVGSAGLIGKVYFPRLIVPVAAAGAALVDLLVSCAILLALAFAYGVGGSVHLLALPVLFLLLVACTLAFGILLSALTAMYRDFTHITPFLLQAWLFLTPVVYPVSIAPPQWRWLLYANPLTGIVEGFRSAFLGRPFDMAGLGASALVSAALIAVAVAYFEKTERVLADVL